MSREEAMEQLIEAGMELRRDDIELGKKLERERIVRLIQDTYEDVAYQERGSLEWTGDVIELIQT